MKAEYRKDCLQRDSVEREGYAGVPSVGTRDNRERDNATQDLLREILRGRNLLEAMKRVKGNKGAAGIDGMTVDELEPWCTEHGRELVSDIWFGRYKPNPVRRKEIPKADGGVRKLGIPTVIDRMVQQAIAQVLQPIYEATFYKGSYGYRVGRSAQQAMESVKEYAEKGYQELICKGWFLPSNTYDCGSFVVNGTAVVGKEQNNPYNRCKSTQKGADFYEIAI